MDLKFTFGGASPDQHDHGDAPSAIPLPFAGASSGAAKLPSTSNILDVVVSADLTDPSAPAVIAEARSGDGVSYGRAEKRLPVGSAPGDGTGFAGTVALATKSALARVSAELGEHLISSVLSIRLELGEQSPAVLDALDLDRADPVITPALQARTGFSAGTPVRTD